MAFDETVASRLRQAFEFVPNVVEKKMFGGIAWMVNGHMACGVNDQRLMARVGPDQYEAALARPHARPMDFTGKPLKGFIFVDPPGFEADAALGEWVQLTLDFVRTLPPK